jgi:hypothetical protein
MFIGGGWLHLVAAVYMDGMHDLQVATLPRRMSRDE